MTLADATESYQASLEHHRAAVDNFAPDEFVEQLAEDLHRAQAAMEVAWLCHQFER